MITYLRKLHPPSSHCICCCLRSPQHVRLSSPGDQEVKRLEDALTKREGIDGRARLSSAVTVFILCSAGACVSCTAKSPPGAFKPSPSPPPPAFRQTLYFSPQCSLPRPPPPPPASFCFPVFSPIIEPPEFGSVGGVAKNATTKGKGGRRNEERRQGHSQFTSQEETAGVGGRKREEEQMRSEEGKKKEMGTGEGERGSIMLPKNNNN